MTIAFAVLEKERPGLSSWEEMGWGGGQFPTAPQLGPHGSCSNACRFAELQSMGLQLVVARVLPECLSPCFHVQRRKPSPGNKLPGVTESRAWQGLASGLAAVPFVAVRMEWGWARTGTGYPFQKGTHCVGLLSRSAWNRSHRVTLTPAFTRGVKSPSVHRSWAGQAGPASERPWTDTFKVGTPFSSFPASSG